MKSHRFGGFLFCVGMSQSDVIAIFFAAGASPRPTVQRENIGEKIAKLLFDYVGIVGSVCRSGVPYLHPIIFFMKNKRKALQMAKKVLQ